MQRMLWYALMTEWVLSQPGLCALNLSGPLYVRVKV